jgi:hypothetical protein
VIRIESTEPAKAKVRLAMDTEVIVAPKKRANPVAQRPEDKVTTTIPNSAAKKKRFLGQFRVIPAEWHVAPVTTAAPTVKKEEISPSSLVAVLSSRIQGSFSAADEYVIELRKLLGPAEKKTPAPRQGLTSGTTESQTRSTKEPPTILHPRAPGDSAPSGSNASFPRESLAVKVTFQPNVPESHIILSTELRAALGVTAFARVRVFLTTLVPDLIPADDLRYSDVSYFYFESPHLSCYHVQQ